MFEWLRRVNGKRLKDDPSLQENQPASGVLEIAENTDISGDVSIDLANGTLESANLTVIHKF